MSEETVLVIEQVYPFPYMFRSSEFAYSLRCALCRMECDHTPEQHDILRFGIEVAK